MTTISPTCIETAPWCGTANGYRRRGCRGEACSARNTALNRAWRERRRQEPTPDHVHGTRHGYQNYGCRCDDCKQAQADAQYRWWHKNDYTESEML